MIYLLRHLSFRIWSVIIFGGAVNLWALPLIHAQVGLAWVPVPAVIILSGTFFIVGWISNWYGGRLIQKFVSEATIWQRAGRHGEAENAYQKAIAVFDSFILTPTAKKKKAGRLFTHLARYYLARVDKNEHSETFIASYLETRPEDSEVAEYWLMQVKNRASLSRAYQDLASKIGNAQAENLAIQQTLARMYLDAGRSDFTALQTYRRVLLGGGDPGEIRAIVVKLSTIFLNEGRADERALDIYLRALQLDETRTELLNGIAACAHWIPESLENRSALERARSLLSGFDPKRLQEMRTGFNPPVVILPREEKVSIADNLGAVLRRALVRAMQFLFLILRSAAVIGFQKAAGLYQAVRQYQKPKQAFKWMLLTALAAGMVWLMVNTVGYLLKSRSTAGKGKISAVITDPFTLQVAAYLKPEHAKKYVAHLRKNKIDAYWTEAKGKKKNWYQVRVSHFKDKESAVAYGESLKTRGLIDDYYVANYARP